MISIHNVRDELTDISAKTEIMLATNQGVPDNSPTHINRIKVLQTGFMMFENNSHNIVVFTKHLLVPVHALFC